MNQLIGKDVPDTIVTTLGEGKLNWAGDNEDVSLMRKDGNFSAER